MEFKWVVDEDTQERYAEVPCHPGVTIRPLPLQSSWILQRVVSHKGSWSWIDYFGVQGWFQPGLQTRVAYPTPEAALAALFLWELRTKP